MKNIFTIGSCKSFSKIIEKSDIAAFESGLVHPVYSTFSICRDAEWTGRLFVLDLKEDDEEGIGTFIEVKHHSPALVGQKVKFEACIIKLEGNTIDCEFKARIGERIIATGIVGQKILKKEKVERIFNQL